MTRKQHFETCISGVGLTCGSRLGHDGRHRDSLYDGGALFGGGWGNAADVEDGGLVSRSSCLGSGNNGGRLAVGGRNQLQDGAGWERSLGLPGGERVKWKI